MTDFDTKQFLRAQKQYIDTILKFKDEALAISEKYHTDIVTLQKSLEVIKKQQKNWFQRNHFWLGPALFLLACVTLVIILNISGCPENFSASFGSISFSCG